jgi:DNA-binding GntR family transcriptional regulator
MARSKAKPDADRAGSIYRTLRHAIIEQALEPGAKLPEDTIGERFGASRTIVRSALGQLAAEGLVELRRNRGAAVATPAWEEARDTFDVRLGIDHEQPFGQICTNVLVALFSNFGVLYG